ncbi:MAG: glutamate-5-semialdehyde dehydrogenase [Candidatus Omnitrophica bacterium]|nr:glutamate-5-semialdehyde dehydrogenase [Candidatus Omnitrophota bacterium]
MNLKSEIKKIARRAQEASRALLSVPLSTRNKVLREMATSLTKNKKAILRANRKDIAKAKRMGLSLPLIDRLALNQKRIKAMADSLLAVSGLSCPVDQVIKSWNRPNRLRIQKIRVPIGVIAIIYESRPNVTSDCIGLCFKTANAVILRGGSEAINSNLAVFKALKSVVKKHKLPDGIINLLSTTDRRAVDLLLKQDSYIDLVIPRGGEGLINRVVRLSRIPVIKHYKGICHVYVDEQADLNLAEKLCFNAKVQRPGVCNAMETMLVHKNIAQRFLPGMLHKFRLAGVEIRGCDATGKIVKGIKRASEKDFHTEYLDLILSVKVVKTLKEAIWHINNYGSRHSDAIVTKNQMNSLQFLRQVDSACVYVNASTRFTDGFQFGMGAEIGISTDKLHARGPMALEELTTYKYMVFGSGQIRK